MEMKAKSHLSHNLLVPNPKQTVGEIMDCQNYNPHVMITTRD